ncbi:MAG: hypothetical protein QM784_12980 [Polyangiaceae bacterium]
MASGGSAQGGASNASGALRFGPAIAIPALLAVGQITTDPTVSADGLEMFFMSTRSGNKALYRTTRASIEQLWTAPELVSELDSPSSESNPRLSGDGSTLWFYSDRDRAKGTLFQSNRATRSSSFGTPVVIAGLSTEGASDVSACPNESRSIAIVATLQDGVTNDYDLYEMRRDVVDAAFVLHSRLPNVNGATEEFDPWLSPDGLHLAFHSNRNGNDDLFYTSRSTLAEDFPPAMPITSVDTAAVEVAPSLSADETRILVFLDSRWRRDHFRGRTTSLSCADAGRRRHVVAGLGDGQSIWYAS